jgi:hypothetical protein
VAGGAKVAKVFDCRIVTGPEQPVIVVDAVCVLPWLMVTSEVHGSFIAVDGGSKTSALFAPSTCAPAVFFLLFFGDRKGEN